MNTNPGADSRLPNLTSRVLCDVLKELEIDARPMLALARISPIALESPWGAVQWRQDIAFQRLFRDVTAHVPGVWRKVGERHRLMALGPLGMAVLTSNTLSEALRAFVALQPCGYSLFKIELVERKGEVVAIGAVTNDVPLDMRSALHECFLGAALALLRDLHNDQLSIDKIESALGPPSASCDLDSAIGAPFVYCAARTQIYLRGGAGALALPMADSFLSEHYRRLGLNLVETAASPDATVNALHQMLRRQHGPFPTASDAATELNISERSLHRRLAEQGMSYQAVLDDVRLRRARELLEVSSLSIAEISDNLGFSEMASFTRFFRRVAGGPPLAYRRLSRGLSMSSV